MSLSNDNFNTETNVVRNDAPRVKQQDVNPVVEKAIKKEVDEKSVQAKPSVTKFAQILADLVNVRKDPSATAEILREVPKGAEFKVLVVNQNGYVKVALDNGEGFIRKDLVKVYDNPSTR